MIVDPNRLYIDRRLGFDPNAPRDELLGSKWIERGTDPIWLVLVVPNENGFLIEYAVIPQGDYL